VLLWRFGDLASRRYFQIGPGYRVIGGAGRATWNSVRVCANFNSKCDGNLANSGGLLINDSSIKSDDKWNSFKTCCYIKLEGVWALNPHKPIAQFLKKLVGFEESSESSRTMW
jgi:hypothetical protein